MSSVAFSQGTANSDSYGRAPRPRMVVAGATSPTKVPALPDTTNAAAVPAGSIGGLQSNKTSEAAAPTTSATTLPTGVAAQAPTSPPLSLQGANATTRNPGHSSPNNLQNHGPLATSNGSATEKQSLSREAPKVNSVASPLAANGNQNSVGTGPCSGTAPVSTASRLLRSPPQRRNPDPYRPFHHSASHPGDPFAQGGQQLGHPNGLNYPSAAHGNFWNGRPNDKQIVGPYTLAQQTHGTPFVAADPAQMKPSFPIPPPVPAPPAEAEPPSPQSAGSLPILDEDESLDPGIPKTITTTTAEGEEASLLDGDPNKEQYEQDHDLPSLPLPKQKTPTQKESTSLKKLPSAVEEAYKVILPRDFFQKSDNNSQQEETGTAFSKLGRLFVQAGGDEDSDIYEKWTNPDLTTSWHERMPLDREPAVVPPQPGSPRTAVLTSTPSKSRRRPRGEDASLIASDVDADTRYFMVSKKAKVMRQPKRSKKGSLAFVDSARFRDHHLLPVDHFVESLEQKSYEKKTQYLAANAYSNSDESPMSSEASQLPLRRRGRYQKSREPMSPAQKHRETESSKAAKPSEGSSRVGRRYQARVPSFPSSGPYEREGYVPECVKIWDPRLAKEAEQRGEDIEGFLNQAVDLTSKSLLMEALHRCNYSVGNAIAEFVTLYRQCKETSIQLPLDDIMRAEDLFKKSRKEFHDIAKTLDRSLSSVLVQYYRWKACDEDGCYTKLKEELKEGFDSNYCDVCDDGGELIVCDHCQKAYHLTCLKPPLSKVPEEDWYCSQCMKSPAKLRRLPAISSVPVNGKRAAEGVASLARARKQLSFSSTDSSSSESEPLPRPKPPGKSSLKLKEPPSNGEEAKKKASVDTGSSSDEASEYVVADDEKSPRVGEMDVVDLT